MHLKESSAYQWVHEIVLSAQFPILSRGKGATAWVLTQPPFPGWSSLLRGWEHPRWTAALTGLSLASLHESHKSGRCLLQNNESLLQNPPKKQSGLWYVFSLRCLKCSHTGFDWLLVQTRKWQHWIFSVHSALWSPVLDRVMLALKPTHKLETRLGYLVLWLYTFTHKHLK